MDTNKYEVIFSPTSQKQLKKIYKYIYEKLSEENAAKRLLGEIEEKIQLLKYAPHIHIKLGKRNLDGQEYRMMVVKNYAIIYVVLENENKVHITHIFYKKSNYFNKL